MINSLIYSLKVASAGLLLTPIIIVFANGMSDPSTVLFIYVVMIVIGGIAAIPGVLVFWLICHFLIRTNIKQHIKNLTLCTIATTFICVAVFFVFHNFEQDGRNFTITLIYAMCYAFITCLAIWYYKIKPATPLILQTQPLTEHI